MLWQTRYILTLLIKHVKQIDVCVTWSMHLHKHSTKYKTDCQQTATKNNNSCAEMLYKKNFLKILQNPQGNIYVGDWLK